MSREPIFEKTLTLPRGYVAVVRLRPSTVKRAALGLLPWAIYAAIPSGKRPKFALALARRLSPLVKQR